MSTKAVETLASCLSKHGILNSKINITFYSHKNEVRNCYFGEENFVFCNNIAGQWVYLSTN